ncbi:tyrosine kinase catalytic domain protein [Rhizoctonia solani AG-3 Rhs1AP]|uniref:Tyrosine kinase catalytic domain protein n=1 Tax=Rhizoctonia solani AG-3 Rhs1AP TaxID=1086054 RepID=X8JAB8_9AGAM|nr:tyrosine kinase catalytic domain protein [Rhizoctonia solani AG-3 Rhs1AP]
MKHRNIHQLMGVILFKDQYLGMVSEWMENGNLREYLQTHPDANRYQLCIDVASGLEYMHARNTVHGDVKALNVLVSPDGIARLSDFDFSVMSEASGLLFTASSNSRSGSVRWVAPEMLAEETPKRTKESDVYALGMVGTIC